MFWLASRLALHRRETELTGRTDGMALMARRAIGAILGSLLLGLQGLLASLLWGLLVLLASLSLVLRGLLGNLLLVLQGLLVSLFVVLLVPLALLVSLLLGLLVLQVRLARASWGLKESGENLGLQGSAVLKDRPASFPSLESTLAASTMRGTL